MKQVTILLMITVSLLSCRQAGDGTTTEMCGELMDMRKTQVRNNMNPISIALTDSMLVRCNCK